MNQSPPDFFDTDGRPDPGASAEAEHKLKVWAVLNAVEQGLMNAEEARAAYGISADDMEHYRASWRDLESGSR
ncbi:hypothetical protein IC235_06080 [Hymenobacter sp. BT664]|uniref:DUF1153 domain-containing protein n=1 Tax=Hymenobacter montanus TaxID=2771359 RepID=A0A927GIJ3_9BACT|nr:hypothetical protein [Hymenobacter montanus]MBD2767457.1 hypothetical protein [Hymenobacter montanus]